MAHKGRKQHIGSLKVERPLTEHGMAKEKEYICKKKKKICNL